MNFFERQDAARRRSKRLIILFALAVLGIVAAVDLALLIVFGGPGTDPTGPLILGALAALVVIGCASAYRVASLGAGGEAVARELGGTPVPEDTTDFQYRRLRNVVEEIAIASGVPVPEIYVLEHEPGINAFAAGYAPADAAVAVTRGALERLNRDELQGVIAHEFSHILNGDMRLNIRLMGVLFGILVLGLIGRKVLQHGRFGRSSRGAVPVLLAALLLAVIGYVGVLFGRLIKAGVSRQREYLADASAVQFTRQTRGLAGALKKIAGVAEGSKLASADGEEVSHMLFGDGVGYSALFATHPPLLARIQALEPTFKPENLEELARRWRTAPPSGLEEDRALGLVVAADAGLPDARAELTVAPPAVVAQVGAPAADDYRRAAAIGAAIPEALHAAAHRRDQVMPLLFGLLLADATEIRQRQRFEIATRHDEATAAAAEAMAAAAADLHPMLRLPLAALAFPVLRRRPRPELERFMDTMYALVHADGRVSLHEYCLATLLRVQVREALDPSRYWRPGRHKLAEARLDLALLLALLASAGHGDEASARRAYNAGLAAALPGEHIPYLLPTEGVLALDRAWPALDRLEPTSKALVIEAVVAAVSHDGELAVAEAELLRTVCAVLHCLLPPMLERHVPPER